MSKPQGYLEKSGIQVCLTCYWGDCRGLDIRCTHEKNDNDSVDFVDALGWCPLFKAHK